MNLPSSTSRYHRLFKEGVWIIVGQILAVTGSIFGVRLLTELLSPADYGQLAVWMTLVSLINYVIFGPLNSGAARFYSTGAEQGDLVDYIGGIHYLALFGTCCMLIIVLITVFISGRIDWIIPLVATVSFAVFSGYNGIFNSIQNAARRRSIAALHQGIEPWVRYLIASISIFFIGSTFSVTLGGYAISAALVLVSQYIFFYSNRPRQLKNQKNVAAWSSKIWKYSWPMAVAGITSWGYLASQIWALELFSTKSNVGFFSVIIQIGFAPLMMLGGVAMTLLMPIIFARAGDGLDKQRFKLSVKPIIKFSLVGFLIVISLTAISTVFHPLVFQLLVAKQYRIFSHYLPFVVLSAGILQVSTLLATIVLASSNTRILLPLNTIGNGIIAATNFIATYFYGMTGIFFAMVIGSVMHLVWNIHNAWRVYRSD